LTGSRRAAAFLYAIDGESAFSDPWRHHGECGLLYLEKIQIGV